MGTSHILIPIDGSSSATQALQYGMQLAKSSGAALVVCVVVDPMTVTGHVTPHLSDAPLIDSARAQANSLVLAAVEEAKAKGVAAEGAVLFGDAAAEIVHHAEVTGCETIVMGTHGCSGFRRLYMGSVARGVFRNAPCPVITVRERTTETAQAVHQQARAITHESPLFMVRLVEVKPEEFDRLYTDIAAFLRQSAGELAGIISSELFGSDDKARILVVVQFASYQDWVHAQWNPEFSHSVEELELTSRTLDFDLYRGERFPASGLPAQAPTLA